MYYIYQILFLFVIYGNTIAYGLIYLGNEYNEQNTYTLLPKKRNIIYVMGNIIYTNNDFCGVLDLEREDFINLRGR